MDLIKLFETQKKLDDRINLEHPALDGEQREIKKILALQTEIAEFANELPEVFKFWSYKQNDYKKALTEAVDCFHYLLSIGNDSSWIPSLERIPNSEEALSIQFNEFIYGVSLFYINRNEESYNRMFESFFMVTRSVGFTDWQIEKEYYKKNKENHERQNDGY